MSKIKRETITTTTTINPPEQKELPSTENIFTDMKSKFSDIKSKSKEFFNEKALSYFEKAQPLFEQAKKDAQPFLERAQKEAQPFLNFAKKRAQPYIDGAEFLKNNWTEVKKDAKKLYDNRETVLSNIDNMLDNGRPDARFLYNNSRIMYIQDQIDAKTRIIIHYQELLKNPKLSERKIKQYENEIIDRKNEIIDLKKKIWSFKDSIIDRLTKPKKTTLFGGKKTRKNRKQNRNRYKSTNKNNLHYYNKKNG
jgi:hypothetical protein